MMNIESIKNLPWLQIAGFSSIGLFMLVMLRKITQLSDVQQTPSQTTPLFLTGTGSTYSASAPGAPILGGEEWAIPTPGDTNAPSDAVLISNNQLQATLAQIAANRAIADKGFELMFRPETNTNNTGNMGSQLLPASIQDQYNDQPQQFYSKPNLTEAVNFVSQKVATGDYFGIYDAAAKHGYSAAQTAQIITRANELAGNRNVVTAADVNQYTSERGLRPLQ